MEFKQKSANGIFTRLGSQGGTARIKILLALALIWVGVLVFSAPSFSAAGGEPPAPATPAPVSGPVTIPANGAHSGVACSDCHLNEEKPTAPLAGPAANCNLCHADQVDSLNSSTHGQELQAYLKNKKGKTAQEDACRACHGGTDVHSIIKHDQPESPLSRGRQIETCLTCHREIPTIAPDKFEQSYHAHPARGQDTPAAVCSDCHSGHDIYKKNLAEATVNRGRVDQTCGKCHDGEYQDYEASAHFNALEKKDPDVPTCTYCHGSHEIIPPTDPNAVTNHLQADLICMGCHTNPDIAKRHPRLPPPEFIKNYTQSVHGRGVHVMGLTVSATCFNCHGAHKILPPTDSASKVNHQNIPNTCRQCHQGIFHDFVASTHGKLWKEKNPKGPVCTTCHSSHGIQEPTAQLFTIFKIDQECGDCHADRRRTYNDTFHGKTTSMGFLVAAKCSDCHTPHHNLPQSDPASSVNSANLTATCGKCHGQVTRNFTKFDPHPDPKDRSKSALLYYINIFMRLLIWGVFGFFGIHTLLWLQRSIVAFIRDEEYATLHLDSDQHVRRWSLSSVVMHILIVTSFLGLVATGLPLRYHYTEWAHFLGSVYGGVEVSRLIHRFCALVTIGYAVYHVVFLFRRIVLKKEYHLLYGPDTLAPRFKDVVDLYDNFKFFFYQAPPPKFGKWTYYEKFDYFALFWGVPIVVGTGLVMLFPNFFSRLLPGTVLNLASLIHSEEALLAAGFVFVFHFFHNHLRPGVIPMDINIFTGTMPLERLIKERPEEYERLQREGLLKGLVIDRPEQRVMLESKLFGLFALATGLFLVVAIFVSFILGTK